MQTNICGKIKNTKLPTTHPLLPLYEAIVNSIDAIEDAGEINGRIDIQVIRNVLKQKDERVIDEIDGFEISDNGIGFNGKNYTSFDTSDSTLKESRGGKGVGRFIWLVAFEKVHINSIFRAEHETKLIQFSFVPYGDGIENKTVTVVDNSSLKTTVKLVGFKEKYRTTCPKKLQTIAVHIIEHCLEYFIHSRCPQIYLHDDQEDICLNEVFEHEMFVKSNTSTFKVRNTEFIAVHVRLNTKYIEEHTVNYLANDRVVKTERLSKKIPNLSKRLFVDAQEFIYAAYIESKFLNEAVNIERTDFNIATDKDLLECITWNDIEDAVIKCCESFLEPYTKTIVAEKQKRIEEFVSNKAPMYRPLMKYMDDMLTRISPDISDSELEIKFFQRYQTLQLETKKEGQVLFEDTSATISPDDYESAFFEYFDKLIDINKSDLARYVCNRKVIIDLFYKHLCKRNDGKYSLEEAIHNIIFPMGYTSIDVPLENHNLWLLDERLVYHSYLASDKQLRTNTPVKINSTKEPDIIVYNTYDKACAFVDSDNLEYSSIVIIEFKRPMRANYKNDDPFKQTRSYIEKINSGKAETQDGRPIQIRGNVPFYCYIICDINDKIKTMARDFELTETPDGEGFFGYKRGYNAYYEVLTYTKILRDAQKRNAIFFEKLGLSSVVKQIQILQEISPC